MDTVPDIIFELVKLGSVGLLSGLFSSFMTSRNYRYNKFWELRSSAYKTLIEELSDIVYVFDKSLAAEERRKELSNNSKKELTDIWIRSFHNIRKSADAGSFLFSDEVGDALAEFIRSCNKDYLTLYDDYDSNLFVARNCLGTIVSASKNDLKVKEPWF